MNDYFTRPVGLLTDSLGIRRFLVGAAALLAAGATAADELESVAPWQPVAEIVSAAENYLQQTLGRSDPRVVPAAGHLDPRLQLPRCTEALDPYLQHGAKTSGRVIVGVRCPGAKPWNIYLPVHIAVMENVLISRQAMPREHLVDADDVEFAVRDVSGLIGGYLTDADAVIGHRLKRSVTRGIVLTPGQLQANVLITRGQTVTLVVSDGSLNISMAGKALMDGAVNQRIRVENTGSGRVVEGLVRSEQLVQVLVQ